MVAMPTLAITLDLINNLPFYVVISCIYTASFSVFANVLEQF